MNDDTNDIKEKTKRNIQNVELNSQQFQEMKEAYNILTSYFKRQEYDKELLEYENRNNNIIDYNRNNNMNNSLFDIDSNLSSNFFNNSFLNMNKLMNDFKIPNISNDNKSYYHSSSYSSSMTNKDGEKEVHSKWETNNNGIKKSDKKNIVIDKYGNIKTIPKKK